MWLHVGMFGTEELLCALSSQLFNHVSELAPTVITLAGIALGIFVCKDGTSRLKHRLADEVLRSDQFKAFVLAADLVVNSGRNLRINFVEWTRHIGVFHRNLPALIVTRG